MYYKLTGFTQKLMVSAPVAAYIPQGLRQKLQEANWRVFPFLILDFVKEFRRSSAAIVCWEAQSRFFDCLFSSSSVSQASKYYFFV
uniref:Uncharacterized protein n=1 Tax=Amphilophus citrinellus TaxID=61819 RepID=A0A3Q0R0H8_AMPCI